MDLLMVKGFEEMTQNEMLEVDGGAIPLIPVIIKGAKAAYSIPPVKVFVDQAAKTAGTLLVTYVAGKLSGIID